MQFSIFAFASALLAVAAAQYGAPAEESCAAVVTVTVTSTLKHVPSAPASHPATGPAPYPSTWAVPASSAPAGTGYPSKPVGTGYPSVPLGASKPTGTAAPSGTGAYSAPPSQFTGAASGLKVGGALAAGAVVALFL
ncbi:hypothetical protein CC86DRAFT_403274 [Ophiobolus disseminans]|uniref:GPI anchored serine-rich protein n=1 Tax=Ophiobolus disseminans TaxID=1469910 RepID=A0A6A7A9H0_9PLEO|nr:hypothetical protein CC86DRAFT_403274 [Ophiobolus disseminans]